jgi:uncharacterized protein (TIGR02147 family)
MDQALLQRANDEIRPTGFLDYRLYLAALYDFLKKTTESYSYQRFAADLGFGPTTVMHQIVRGRRPLTAKAAAKVVKALQLKGHERRFLLALVDYCNARSSQKREELFEKMIDLKSGVLPTEFDKDTLEYYSEWYHPVIRELVATREFKADPEWIAQTIVPRLRPEQARESLALLERLELIRFDESAQRWTQSQKRLSTGHRVKGMALTRYHQKMIELGREALTRIPSKRRDISALTLNVDDETAERLKGLIHAFQIQLLDEAEKSPGDEVYQLNIQLFPFTGDDKKGKP